MAREEHELRPAFTATALRDVVAIPWRRFFRRVEDAIGSFFTAFIDCGVIGTLGLVAIDSFMERGVFRPDPLLMALAFLLAVMINGRHLVWLWVGWSDRGCPAAIATALQQRVWLVALRPLMSAWWLASMFPPVAMILASHGAREEQAPAIVVAIFGLMTFGLLYAANGFLLMAVSVWTKNERILQRVWSFRILFDLGVTAIGISLSPLLFGPSRMN